jgi:hypothetical protein
MIQRDFVLRQIQQLVQVLAQVAAAARAGRTGEAQRLLEEGVQAATGRDIDELQQSERAPLVLRYGSDSSDPALGLALADLLARDAHAEGRHRALWLYQDAARGPLRPIDLAQRVERLRATLD